MKYYKPKMIYIEKEARKWPLTEAILRRVPDVPVRDVEDLSAELQKIKKKPDPIGAGKQILYLAHDRGRSFKPFPESERYLSCDYFTLHLSEGCDLECSYCILQAYLTNPLLTVYTNLEETLARLQETLNSSPGRFFRIGTGQLADSLSLDHLTAFSEVLVPFFANQSNAVLELKTKSDNISRLLHLTSRGQTIVSWSMNTHEIQKKEEHKTAALQERLTAAETLCRLTDFRVAFHFDPIIDMPDWEADYKEIITELFTRVPADRVAWISLGCLRFMPSLKPVMEKRFPKSGLAAAEWIKGMDGKMRYFKPKRVAIYKSMVSLIRAFTPNTAIYLSMESPEVWTQVFGGSHGRETVCRMLDEAGRQNLISGRQPAGKKASRAPITVSQKIVE